MVESDNAVVKLDKQEGHVALVTINRPEVRNAVNAAVARALASILKQTENDANIWTVVLTGAGGKVFCAGADLKEVAQGNIEFLMTADGGFAGFVHAQRTKPWIAAVEGMALAGGCEIALACDLIVATEGGAFGLPEVARGLAASAGGLYRLPRALPKGVAIDMILTAEQLSAERATASGMVSRLAPAGRAVETALELARAINRNAPVAVRESLAVARRAYDLMDVELRQLSDQVQARLERTEDLIEGARAFVEKRPPAWKGR